MTYAKTFGSSDCSKRGHMDQIFDPAVPKDECLRCAYQLCGECGNCQNSDCAEFAYDEDLTPVV